MATRASQPSVALSAQPADSDWGRRRLRSLHDVAAAVGASLQQETVVANAVSAIASAAGAAACILYMLEDHTLHAAAATGVPSELLDGYSRIPLDSQHMAAKAATTGLPRVSRRPRATQADKPLFTALGLMEHIAVPLRAGSLTLGVIYVASDRTFTSDDQIFLQTLADLVAPAIRNARLHEETVRERRRARYLAEVGRTLNARLELVAVAETVAATATGALGDWCAVVQLAGGDAPPRIVSVFHRDPTRQSTVAPFVTALLAMSDHALIDRAVQMESPVWLRTGDLEGLREQHAATIDALDTVACLPLITRGGVIGALITGGSGEQLLVSGDDLLAMAFADRAAAALDNAQLFEATARQARRESFLAETGRLLAESLDPLIVLERLAERATEALGDACLIFMLGGRRGALPPVIAHHVRPEIKDLLQRNADGRNLRNADAQLVAQVRGGGIVVANGSEAVTRLNLPEGPARFMNAMRVSAVMFVPIRGARALRGLMLCLRQDGQFYTDDDQRLALRLADQASVTITNAELYAATDAERARLKTVLDRLPEAVLIAEPPEGRVVLANDLALRLLGRDGGDQPGEEHQRYFDLVAEDGEAVDTEQLPLSRALAGETVAGEEAWVQHPDGRRIPILVNAAPVRDADGNVFAAVVVFQDASAIKDAERAKDEWLSMASHELRTPITSLKGFTQLLQRQVQRGNVPTLESLGNTLSGIDRQTVRLARLIDDLLDVSRIQLGRLVLHPAPTDLVDVVDTVVHRLAADSGAGSRLVRDYPEVPVVGEWDGDRLDQVITNLLSNALKYSPEGGEVRVKVAPTPDGGAVVSVADTGIGISPEEAADLFRPFARARGAVQRGIVGVGLGLYVSRDIVERHGGKLLLDSREGQGSTFTVVLPSAIPPAHI